MSSLLSKIGLGGKKQNSRSVFEDFPQFLRDHDEASLQSCIDHLLRNPQTCVTDPKLFELQYKELKEIIIRMKASPYRPLDLDSILEQSVEKWKSAVPELRKETSQKLLDVVRGTKTVDQRPAMNVQEYSSSSLVTQHQTSDFETLIEKELPHESQDLQKMEGFDGQSTNMMIDHSIQKLDELDQQKQYVEWLEARLEEQEKYILERIMEQDNRHKTDINNLNCILQQLVQDGKAQTNMINQEYSAKNKQNEEKIQEQTRVFFEKQQEYEQEMNQMKGKLRDLERQEKDKENEINQNKKRIQEQERIIQELSKQRDQQAIKDQEKFQEQRRMNEDLERKQKEKDDEMEQMMNQMNEMINKLARELSDYRRENIERSSQLQLSIEQLSNQQRTNSRLISEQQAEQRRMADELTGQSLTTGQLRLGKELSQNQMEQQEIARKDLERKLESHKKLSEKAAEEQRNAEMKIRKELNDQKMFNMKMGIEVMNTQTMLNNQRPFGDTLAYQQNDPSDPARSSTVEIEEMSDEDGK